MTDEPDTIVITPDMIEQPDWSKEGSNPLRDIKRAIVDMQLTGASYYVGCSREPLPMGALPTEIWASDFDPRLPVINDRAPLTAAEAKKRAAKRRAQKRARR